jgi:two-component system, sensor histidine kinase
MDTTTWIAVAAAAIAVGALLVALVRVTALERQREAIVRRADDAERALERERERLAELEAAAREALARADEARAQISRFLAAASHDLRQPVHAIALFVAALQTEPLTGRAHTLVERLDRSLSGLDELFNRLLDISRLDAGALQPSRSTFAIDGLLRPLEARFGQVAADRGLRLRVHAGRTAWVDSDAALLVEMLMNLLSNAFRYTARGGVLLAARRRGGRLLLQVWDTGAGIPRDRLETIFEEFVQLDNPSHDRRRGLGLGLAIVQRLSIALDHPVSVRSQLGHGSVFTISVPLVAAPPEAAPADETTGCVDIGGLLALVVDDEIDILVATESLLSAWGCFVLPARSTAEALQRLDVSERYPDLLITDHRIGDGQTGFEVIEAVRRAMPMPIPVLMWSGDADPALARRAREAGLLHLDKPIDPRRLRSVLDTVARGLRAQDPDVDA